MARAADQHAALGAQHLGGLVQHDLDGSRVAALARGAVLRGELAGALAGDHVRRADERALGLGDGRVGDRDELSVAQLLAVQRRHDQLRQVVAGADLGDAAGAAVRTGSPRRPALRRGW